MCSRYRSRHRGGRTVSLDDNKHLARACLIFCDRDNDEDFVTIPGLAGGAVGTKYDWNTSYAADEALGGRAISIPQGKVVGGSTKLNRMVFDRGARSDYDGWETLGSGGWNFETLLPYFKKVSRTSVNIEYKR